MDVDNSPELRLNCFVCNASEMPVQKLGHTTPKGCPTLLAYAGAVGNVILEPMKKAWNVRRLRYHVGCKCDLYKPVTMKSIRKCFLFY